MSIFKTKWIILKVDSKNPWISKTKSPEFLYTIFTKEYGKILCNTKLSKKEKSLDLWYLINFEIITKENASIHKVRNIKILSEFNTKDKPFKEINAYLIILSTIYKKIPKWAPIYELFELLETINSYPQIDDLKLILTRLKILAILWELNENHSNDTVWKILKFINANKIDRILKLTWINEELKKELEII